MDMNDPDVKDVAESERDKMSQLKHEHIVAYRECFIDGGFMWLVMEYCEGGDLAEAIAAQKIKAAKFSEDQIVSWTYQMCLGLEVIIMMCSKYLHDRRKCEISSSTPFDVRISGGKMHHRLSAVDQNRNAWCCQ
jgi:serine/threonine protein kinase